MIKKMLLGSLLWCLLHSVQAVPLSNGDFSSALNGWTDASGTGSVVEVGGVAQLETGAGTDPFSGVLVQGDDGFFSFAAPITLDSDIKYLSFDAEFIDLGADGTEAGASFFSDAFFVGLYDADGSNLTCDISGCFDPDDVLINPFIDVSVSGMLTYQFDISSLAGRSIALSFELSDEDDGFNSRVRLDNIAFIAQPVSEPPLFLLLGLGLSALLVRRRRVSTI